MERSDWILLALAASNGRPLTPAQLQKSLFLLGQAMPPAQPGDFYSFVPYHYGPFDVSVYHDAERLAEQGLVTIAQADGRRWSEYSITQAGMVGAARLRAEAPQPLADHLARIVEWAQRLSFQDLVRAVYERYPEFRANSVFQG